MIDSPLYKRAANGAIRKWYVEVNTNGVGAFVITRHAGQLNGSFTQAFDFVVSGKNIGRANETTPEEQAEFDAKSYWNKKKDEGYKTLDEVGALTEADLYGLLTKYNTDAQGNIKPMLAKAVNWAKVKFPVFVQPKLDGVRCLMIVTNGEVMFLSRSGKVYHTLGHIENEVLDLVSDIDSFILDGEIYSHDISFQEIISAVKAQGPNSTKLHYRVYDVVNSALQANRLIILQAFIKEGNFKHIHLVPTTTVDSKDEVMFNHSEFRAAGYEGLMIRFRNGTYKQGVRSSELLKVKEFNEEEFECYELIEGKREEDVIALCLTKEGKEFKAKMMGTREEKELLVQVFSPCLLTVKFFGWTNDQIPRFPIGKTFRDYE